MTKHKYDENVAYNLRFKAQKVMELMLVAAYANGSDQDYWFDMAIEYADKLAHELSAYQQDLYYQQNPVDIDDQIPF